MVAIKPKLRMLVSAVAVLLGSMIVATGPVNADLVYSFSQGADSATADFKFVAGGIEMIVTNTESNTGDSANAISQVQVTFANGMTVPVALSELSGQLIEFTSHSNSGDAGTLKNFLDSKPYTYSSSDVFHNGHWEASNPTTHSLLLDALPNGPNKQMIAAANSLATAGSMVSQSPFFNGSANFFWADSHLPSKLDTTNITGVTFSFGTGVDVFGTGTGTGTSVPPGFDTVPVPGSLT